MVFLQLIFDLFRRISVISLILVFSFQSPFKYYWCWYTFNMKIQLNIREVELLNVSGLLMKN